MKLLGTLLLIGLISASSAGPVFSAAQSTAIKIPFELSNNLILVQVQVNDSPPHWFFFDTGASASVIDAQLAKSLNLQAKAKARGTASGGAIEAEMIPGVSLSVSGVKVSNQTLAALSLGDFSPVFGKSIGGIIGYDFIKQFVVEVDYAAKQMNLYDPGSYRYRGSGDVLPVKFIDNKPFINTKLKPEGLAALSGLFMIDTGADTAMTVNSPFVRAHQLLKSLSRTQQANLGGAGGVAETINARIENIQLGRFIINKPVVSFSQAKEGSDALAEYAGVLGGETFRRFTLTLDYARQRIILEPNSHLAEPVEQDMSGIELAAEGDDYNTLVINEVAQDSPALEAGLKEEDYLLAINGHPIAELGIDRVRQMFRQEGKEYLLTIKRADQTLQVKIRTRRLI